MTRSPVEGIKSGVRSFLGERDEMSGPMLSRLLTVALMVSVVFTNLIGAAAVLAVIYLVLPLPAVGDESQVRLVNAIAAGVYIPVAVVAGAVLGRRSLSEMQQWLRSETEADDRVRRTVVRAPLLLFRLQVSLWFGAAAIFAILNAFYSVQLAIMVMVAIGITGVTTGATAYLIAERIMRKPASRALARETPERLQVPGVATRAMLAWALGTGGPLIGLVAVGIVAMAGVPATKNELELAIVTLGGIAVVVGLLAVFLAARATSDPIDAVRGALESVQRGEFDVRVPVYDGTQIGRLQLGFNRMVEGLAERERIRETLGTYVDPDVAERILEEGAQDGEEVEATIMFIDVRGFTAFAEDTPAPEVVSTINALFGEAIPVIHDEGGRVDKFVGDGILAVFGTPRRLDNHADAGLRAALEISKRVEASDGPLEIGIGLNSGVVVAGNVGGAGRLEFSVIGDPVNVAARVESATRETGDVILLSERTRELLSGETVELIEREGIKLKGKSESVRLYAPAAGLVGGAARRPSALRALGGRMAL